MFNKNRTQQIKIFNIRNLPDYTRYERELKMFNNVHSSPKNGQIFYFPEFCFSFQNFDFVIVTIIGIVFKQIYRRKLKLGNLTGAKESITRS